MRDAEDILSEAFDVAEPAETTIEAPETPEAPVETPSEQPQEAPETPQEAQAAPEPAQPAEEPKQDPPMVPAAVVWELRERVRRAEEAAGLRGQPRQEPEQAQPEEIPDPVTEPDAWRAYQERKFEQIEWGSTSKLSLHLADQVHGPGKAFEAAKSYLQEAYRRGPVSGRLMLAELRQQEHPYQFCIDWKARQDMLTDFNPDEFAAFKAWKAGQTQQPQGGNPAPPAPAAPSPTPPPPAAPSRPPVIANAPSAGGVSTQVEPDPLEAVFPE